MEYLLIILTICLSFTFHPLYNNFTSLLVYHHYVLYFGWLIINILFIFIKLYHLSNRSNRRILYLISCLFIIGTFLSYHLSTSDLTSFLHVGLTFLALILTFVLLKLIIKQSMLTSYKKANQVDYWLNWQISIIILLLMMFGTINGIIEIVTLSSILLTMRQLSH